jgi:hypothetical protein
MTTTATAVLEFETKRFGRTLTEAERKQLGVAVKESQQDNFEDTEALQLGAILSEAMEVSHDSVTVSSSPFYQVKEIDRRGVKR